MPDAGLGNKSYAGLNFETAWGTKNTDLTQFEGVATGLKPWIDINSETLTVEERPLRSASLTGIGPLYNKIAPGPRGITGDIVWTPNYDSETIQRLFRAAMGFYLNVGNNEIQYRPDDKLPAVTAEVHLDKTAVRFYGGSVSQLRGTVSPDSFFDITASFIFKDFDEIAYVDWKTVSFDGTNRDTLIRSDHLSIARFTPEGGSNIDIASVRDFEFFYDNRLNPDRRVLGSRLIKEPDRTDRLATGGRAVLEFDDATLFYQFYTQTVGQMIFKFDSGEGTASSGTNFSIIFDWPRARIATGTPTVNAFGIITLEVEWEGLQGVDGDFGTDAALIATIINNSQLAANAQPANYTSWTP